jgi:hypothetical protein
MPTLRYRFNYRQDALPPRPTTHYLVGVFTRTGDTERVRWLGNIDLDHARQLPEARPVRLDVRSYTLEEGEWVTGWQDVPDGWFVQGALVSTGVYGVIAEGQPRLVQHPET